MPPSSLPFPFPLPPVPLEVGPLNTARGTGERAVSSPSGVWGSCIIQQSSCYTCYTEDSCRPAIIDSRQKQRSQISFHTLSCQKI